MRLIINGYNIEIDSDEKISRTLQVNDIADLENRQANYSATFKIPRTANNVRAFNRLGINGNNSNTPYQRNNAYLYADNEECIVYNGWAVIKETSEYYSANIIDGNIDLYKAIENTTLSDLDLSDVNHFKTLDNVVNSFDGSNTYKYILADYNGKAFYDTDKINIDYLVPSLPVSYLWDKIFETYGFTYEGQVFNTFNYENLFLTYPKGTADANEEPDIYVESTYNNLDVNINGTDTVNIVHENPTLNDGTFLSNDIGFVVPNDGTYVIASDLDINVFINVPPEGLELSNYVLEVLVNGVVVDVLQGGASNLGTNPLYLQLNAGDIITLQIGAGDEIDSVSFNSGSITYGFLAGFNINFNETFIDFDTKDFLKMVLNRFGLTPFKDKYTNHYKFLTLEERLQTAEVEDWSSYNNKFQRKVKESYIYGNYAQQNDFTYKYNDQESTYNDGFILIDNVNLEDNKTVVKSKIYSPEKLPTNIFEKQTNVYKLWDKEVKDDGSVTYKELDKRFYLLRSDNYVFNNSVTIGSETLQTETTISQAPFESFFKLSFSDIIEDYYTPLSQILDKARVEQHEIYLTQTDVVNINFETLKWIEDLNNYYILNKVSNFRGTDIVKCEMIKVNYVVTPLDEAPEQSIITINSATTTSLNYTNTIAGLYALQYSTDIGSTWQNSEDAQDGVYYLFATTGSITGLNFSTSDLIRFINTTTNEVVSNTFEI